MNEEIELILLDLLLGSEDARLFLDKIQHLKPTVKIIVVSSLEDITIVKALLQKNVQGFVGKSSSTHLILEAMNTVMQGKTFIDPFIQKKIESLSNNTYSLILTQREREVLIETLKERKIKEIAALLNVTEKTVENHRSNLFTKFEVTNITGLVKKAILMGFLEE